MKRNGGIMKQMDDLTRKEKKPPLEYKLLEYRMRINQELFDEKFIDYETFHLMEGQIVRKMKKCQEEMMKL